LFLDEPANGLDPDGRRDIHKTKNPVGGFEAGQPGEKRHSPGNKTPMA